MNIDMPDYILHASISVHKVLTELKPDASVVDHIHGTNTSILESALCCISSFYCEVIKGINTTNLPSIKPAGDDKFIPEEIIWMLGKMDITETQQLSVLLSPIEQAQHVYETWRLVCMEDSDDDMLYATNTTIKFNDALEYLSKNVMTNDTYAVLMINTQKELRRRYEDFPEKYPLAAIINTIDMYIAMEASRINYGIQAYQKLVDYYHEMMRSNIN